ncbi:hypothetical protein JTE90_027363 [Oedothorax gibbosus]|uniref:Uncharacterized protein n=1 Tax=Oedothorax gibbosus TaxID=931172 RepID=A0AAV6VYW6_9ARAC|nr:hypothetical protein JTE90_027363 [Oedothorax gibbosus]
MTKKVSIRISVNIKVDSSELIASQMNSTTVFCFTMAYLNYFFLYHTTHTSTASKELEPDAKPSRAFSLTTKSNGRTELQERERHQKKE